MRAKPNDKCLTVNIALTDYIFVLLPVGLDRYGRPANSGGSWELGSKKEFGAPRNLLGEFTPLLSKIITWA